MNVRARFAPSPTGPLHVGGVRTALFNYLFAKKHGGDFVLRIEDTDQARFVEGAEQYIIESLKWCGIEFDESVVAGGDFGPYCQSQRSDLYLLAWQQLAQQKSIYPSPQSRRDIDTAAFAPHVSAEGESVFPAAYRPNEWVVPEHPGCVPWRFRVPDGKAIEFVDKNFGLVKRIAGVDFGDFIIWRRDSLAAYELAVVVDDHYMKIDEPQ